MKDEAIAVTLSAETRAQIDALAERMRFDTRAQAIALAMNVCQDLLHRELNGAHIEIHYPDKSVRLYKPFLSH